MDIVTEDRVKIIIADILDEWDVKKVDVALCMVKHKDLEKEVDGVSKKLDKLIFLFMGTFLTGIVAVVVALIK